MEKTLNNIPIKPKNQAEVCRLCFQNESDLTPLKEKRKNTTILDFLKKISRLKFDNLENTSDKICSKCLNKTEIAMQLTDLCKQSEERWIKDLSSRKNSKNKKKSEESEEKQKTAAAKSSQPEFEEISIKVEEDDFQNPSDNEYFEAPTNNIEIKQSTKCSQLEEKIKVELEDEDQEESVVSRQSPERNFECLFPGCDKMYVNRNSLANHGAKHHPGWEHNIQWKTPKRIYQKHVCSLCGKSYSRPDLLNDHEKSHILGKKPYECDICGALSSSKKYLQKHMIFVHLKRPKIYNCEYCGKQFWGMYDLKDHLNIHTKAVWYDCSLCDKKFLRKTLLQIHQRVHTKIVRSFKCKFCERVFRHATDRKRHSYTHTGGYPFVCDFPGCGKGFAQERGIRNHTQTHFPPEERLRNYKCSYPDCGKDFIKKDTLMRHEQKQHLPPEKRKLMKCHFPGCWKDFVKKENFDEHQEMHKQAEDLSVGQRRVRPNVRKVSKTAAS